MPIFSSSLLESHSVFETSTSSTDVETLFETGGGSSQSAGYRGRLPGRLSSSSLGINSEHIRSVSNIFPRPEFVPTSSTNEH